MELPYSATLIQECLARADLYPEIDKACGSSRVISRSPQIKYGVYPGLLGISARGFLAVTRRYQVRIVMRGVLLCVTWRGELDETAFRAVGPFFLVDCT